VSKYEDEINEILNRQYTVSELKERLVKTRELLAMANQCDRGQVLKRHLKLCETLLSSIRCHDCVREFGDSIKELKELYEYESDDNKGYV
tara:strand:- start:4053 stop:4322 length:270 start_codon:yes stop_codon:yes gene_type:complete